MCEATQFCYKSVIKHTKSSFYIACLTHLARVSILSLQMAKYVVDSLNACATNGSTAICNQLGSMEGKHPWPEPFKQPV